VCVINDAYSGDDAITVAVSHCVCTK